MSAFYIGVDPGVSGGIAVLSAAGGCIAAVPMPATEQELLALLVPWRGESRAMLERVRSSPQMGVVSAFTFGRGYGALRMALVASAIPFDEPTPQTWQRAMQCLSKGDKNVTKRRATELWPERKITHAIADALLLAEYCRRTDSRPF